MRRAFLCLLILAVLWCGLHLAERAEARSAPAAAELCAGGDCGDDGHDQVNPSHACHHHCPIAPDLRGSEAAELPALQQAARVVSPATRLHSLPHAPPLEPPTA